MNKKILILIILIIAFLPIMEAQKILTLKECYDLAMNATALSGERTAYSEISRLKDNNLSKGWLPTLDANGSLLYNSSVVDMSSVLSSLPVQGIAGAIKPLPHEQYKISIDINQVIYDAGAIKGARALGKADLSVNEKQTETDLYKIRGQINSCYFGIMSLEMQQEQLNSFLDLIKEKISSIQSAINNGVVLKSDLDILTAEKIRLEQQLSENMISKTSLLKILSDLTGKDVDFSTKLVLPVQTSEPTNELLRPELQLYNLKNEQLGAGMKLIESKRLPKAYGFATFGYGNPPGSNFFKDQFAPYYVLGAVVKWNIFDWNTANNEKQIITFQQSIIENRKTDLSENLNRQLLSKNAEIQSLKTIIETDSELITLRKRITASAESQYQNGIITATEYLNEMNSERQAIILSEIHKINLALARVEYLNISGKEIE